VKTSRPARRDGADSGATPLRVLIVEHAAADAELMVFELERAGFAVSTEVVRTPEAFLARLDSGPYDVVLSDYRLPQWTAMDALAILRRRSLETPLIVVTGTLGDERAVDCVKQGAADYVIKEHLARLPFAVHRALEDRGLRDARRISEERYRLLFESTPLPVWVFDLETHRILAVNEAAVRHYGYTREEFLARRIEELRPPGDVSALQEHLRHVPPEPHHGGTWRHRKKDGTAILVEVSGHALTWDGREAELVLVNDVTERKQAEDALREREERFRQLAENIEEVFFVMDAQYQETLYISPAYEVIWGQSCRSLYDNPRSFLDPIPAEDRDVLLASIARIQAGEDPGKTEFRVIADGRVRWLLSHAMPIRNDRGEVYRIAGVALDITERKQAEQALAERARISALGADVGAALTQDTGLKEILHRCCQCLVHHLDATFARIWTLNVAEQVLELQASAGLYTHIDGAHSRVPVGEYKIGLIASERRPHVTNAVVGDPRVHDQDWAKREGMVAFAGYPLLVQDRVVGVMAMFARRPFDQFVQQALAAVADGIAVGVQRKRAETELRATQAHLEQVLASSNAVIYTLGVTGGSFAPSWVSENVSRITGYDVAEALAPDWWLTHLHPEDRDTALAGLAALWAEGRCTSEYRFQQRSGTYLWVHDELRLVRDARGDAVEAVGAWIDITERRQLEQQFHQAQKMEAVGRLAGGVAHDFNNLLTAILGSAELVLETLPPDAPEREDVEEIHRAGQRAATLTRQLLAFSRRQVLTPQVLDLNTLVGNMEKLLQRLIGEDVELRTACAPDLGAVRVDPGQVEQIIVNLAVNAREAMAHGGKLTIETRNADLDPAYAEEHFPAKPGAYVLLAVTDTGIGMDAATKSHMFEPFFTTKEKGTGLGLATVYGIVKQSGGYIWVYSEPQRGTAFKIYLPRVAEAPEPLTSGPEPLSLRGTETILLVEDDNMVRALTVRMLEARGFTVLSAAHGEEALRRLEDHAGSINLLVTDVVMPGLSGRDLATRVAGLRPDIKVLYLSGYTDDAIVRHGVLEPGIAFLQKPFTPDSLVRKVREVLDGR
jgi:PAS domain S-box-containing protein